MVETIHVLVLHTMELLGKVIMSIMQTVIVGYRHANVNDKLRAAKHAFAITYTANSIPNMYTQNMQTGMFENT